MLESRESSWNPAVDLDSWGALPEFGCPNAGQSFLQAEAEGELLIQKR